jgi:hypothetical protein
MGRREFLGTAAGVAVTLRSFSRSAEAAGSGGPFDRAMRWGQLAFVENEPGRYDRANSVCRSVELFEGIKDPEPRPAEVTVVARYDREPVLARLFAGWLSTSASSNQLTAWNGRTRDGGTEDRPW